MAPTHHQPRASFLRRAGRWALTLACLTATGCFSQFEEYRQVAVPMRPAGAESIPEGPPPEVFPLLPGARFDYEARFGLGADLFSGEAIVSVLDAWQTGGQQEQQLSVVSRYFGQERREVYRFVRTDDRIGLYEKHPPDQITFFLPTALSVGQRWPVITGEGPGTAWVEAQEAVEVPAGAFPEALRVRYVNPGAKTDVTLWLAPAVGLVQADVAMQVNVLPLRGRLKLRERAQAL